MHKPGLRNPARDRPSVESITLLRKRLGLTQADLAERLSVSRVTISRWENGQVRPSKIALKALEQLAQKIPSNGPGGGPEERPGRRPEQSARRVSPPVPGRLGPGQAFRRGDYATVALPRSHPGIQALSKCPLFSDLDDGRLSELSRLARKRDLKAGEFLFLEDDPADSCYLVVSGMVKVMKHSASGKDFVTATYGPGEMMGNLLLFLDSPYTASCQAVVDTSVLALGSENFLSFLHRHPEPSFFVLEKMLRVAGKRHIDVTARLSEFASQRVDRRLAHVLLMLSWKFGLTIPLTRREIADMAGTTTETAIRFVSRLGKMGVVKSSRGKIAILRPDGLERLSGSALPGWDAGPTADA